MLDFFIEYANSSALGQIANTHLVHADLNHENKYAGSKVCKKLAILHGKAVDFAKSGERINLDKEDRIK